MREGTDTACEETCPNPGTCEDSVESIPLWQKRSDTENKKREVTDKARKQGLLKQSQIGPFGSQVTRLESREPSHVPILVQAQVESVPQVRSRAPWGARSGDAGLPGCPLKRRSRS